MRLNCSSCGKFVSYKVASVIVKSDGYPEPSPIYLFFCQKCSDRYQINPFMKEPNKELQEVIKNLVEEAENDS